VAGLRVHAYWASRLAQELGLDCSPDILGDGAVDLAVDCPGSFCISPAEGQTAGSQPSWCGEPRYKPRGEYLDRLRRWDAYCRERYLRCRSEARERGLSGKQLEDLCHRYELLPKLGVHVFCAHDHDLRVERWGGRCSSARGYIELARALAVLLCAEPVEGDACDRETLLGLDGCCRYLVDLHAALDMVAKGLLKSPEELERWGRECAGLYPEVVEFVKRHWTEIAQAAAGKG
jgi:hypothetical protein